MNFMRLSRKQILLASCSSLILPLVMTSCEETNLSEPTERPKTIDDLILEFSNGMTLEFSRSSGSPLETSAANPTYGSVLYTQGGDFNTLSEANLSTDFYWPTTLSTISYTYTPVSDNSAIIQLSTTGGDYKSTSLIDETADPQPVHIGLFDDADFGAVAGDVTLLGNAVAPNPVLTNIFISFNNDGFQINDCNVVMQADTTDHVTYHNSLSAATIVQIAGFYQAGVSLTTTDGGLVPVNYTQEELTGDITPVTLNALKFNMDANTDGIYDEAYTFSSVTSTTTTEEEGTAEYYDANNALAGTFYYTYTRGPGLSTAALNLYSDEDRDNLERTITFEVTSETENISGFTQYGGTYNNSATQTFILTTNQ